MIDLNKFKQLPTLLYALTTITIVFLVYAALFGVWVNREMRLNYEAEQTAQELFEESSSYSINVPQKSLLPGSPGTGPASPPFSIGPSYPPPPPLN